MLMCCYFQRRGITPGEGIMYPKITQRHTEVPESEVHDLLRNERRRRVIKYLQQTVGSTTLRELAESIAEKETGISPPPKNIRQSVYNSLHQTHLPKLDELGVITYDSDRKTISLSETARTVDVYMEVVTPFGITWSEFYRLLGSISLFVVLVSLLGFPVISMIDPLLWTTLFLGTYTVSIAYQLWCHRWLYLNLLLN